MKLSDLNLNETCQIQKINLPSNQKKHLQDIGIIEGNQITCVLKSPFNDPKAYKINGIIIAIRQSEASQIEVKLIEN